MTQKIDDLIAAEKHSKTGIAYKDAIAELQEVIADCDAYGIKAKTPLPVRIRVLCDVVIEAANAREDIKAMHEENKRLREELEAAHKEVQFWANAAGDEAIFKAKLIAENKKLRENNQYSRAEQQKVDNDLRAFWVLFMQDGRRIDPADVYADTTTITRAEFEAVRREIILLLLSDNKDYCLGVKDVLSIIDNNIYKTEKKNEIL